MKCANLAHLEAGDAQIAESLEPTRACAAQKGQPHSLAMIKWIRYRYRVPGVPSDET